MLSISNVRFRIKNKTTSYPCGKTGNRIFKRGCMVCIMWKNQWLMCWSLRKSIRWWGEVKSRRGSKSFRIILSQKSISCSLSRKCKSCSSSLKDEIKQRINCVKWIKIIEKINIYLIRGYNLTFYFDFLTALT